MSTTIGIILLAAVVVVILLPTPLDSILVCVLVLLPIIVWAFLKRR